MPRVNRRIRKRRRLLLCLGGVLLAAAVAVFLLLRAKTPARAEAAISSDAALDAALDATPAAAPEATAAPTAAAATATPAATAPAASPTPALTAVEGRSRYEAVIDADPDAGTADIQVRLTFFNAQPDMLYEAALRLWPNAVEKGCVRLRAVTLNGTDAYYSLSLDDTMLRIPITPELAPGDTATLYLSYTLDVPERAGRFGRGKLGMTLGNVLPAIGVYQDGAWRADPYSAQGDPFCSDTADYRVVLRCPKGYQIAATGSVSEAKMDEETSAYEGVYLASNARDFALCVYFNPFVQTKTAQGGAEVSGYSNYNERAQLLCDTAAGALDYFSAHIGAYPYDSFCAVGANLAGGMEYPGLVLIDNEKLKGNATAMGEVYIAHEAAHQWFYAALGTDQYASPWVDEALVEFLGFDYIRSVYGQTYMEELAAVRFAGMADYPLSLRMDASLGDYAEKPDADYLYGVYGRGYLLYEALYQKLGAETFYAALQSLYTDHLFKSVSGEELIAAFSKAAGENLTDFFESYLSGTQDPAAQDATTW